MKTHPVFFSAAIILAFLLPHSSIFFLAVNPIIWCALFFLNKKEGTKTWIFFPAAIGLIVSASANFLNPSITEFKTIGRIASLFLYLFLFPVAGKERIPLNVLYFIIFVIIGSQLAFAFNIGPAVSLIEGIWPYEGDDKWYQTEYLTKRADYIDSPFGGFRWGGLYRNPNQCVRYVSTLFAVFLLETKDAPMRKRLFFYPIFAISVILSGSRTGFAACAALALFDLIFFRKKTWAKWLGAGLAISGLLFTAISSSMKGTYRALDLEAGFSDSFATKFSWFLTYFENLGPWEFLFGALSPTYIESYGIPMLDSEWGYYFYLYGIVASIGLLISIGLVWKNGGSNTRFFMIVSLWGMTSSILLANRMSFIFLLFLSVYFCKDKRESILNKRLPYDYKAIRTRQ